MLGADYFVSTVGLGEAMTPARMPDQAREGERYDASTFAPTASFDGCDIDAIELAFLRSSQS
jgi:hypothetical protein